jgi:DNA-binding NarL/FixJ family response regulator
MNKEGCIIIIEDDTDDIDFYDTIFKQLKIENEIKVFREADSLFPYLRNLKVKPFIILSDVNLVPESGFEIRKQINKDPELSRKCIPYIFFTTDASLKAVQEAYMLSVQGIFQKPNEYKKWVEIINSIFVYWSECMSPR